MGVVAAPGGQDVFVLSAAPGGHLRFSARLGGRSSEVATALSVRPDGSLQLSGQTNSPDFPLLDPVGADAPDGVISELPFLARTNATATALRSSSFLPVLSRNGVGEGWLPDVRVEASVFGGDTLFAAGYTNAWRRNESGEWDGRTIGRYIRKWTVGPGGANRYGNGR